MIDYNSRANKKGSITIEFSYGEFKVGWIIYKSRIDRDKAMKLLSESNPKYLRRLIKEINKGCDAPYSANQRVLAVKLSGSEMLAKFLGHSGWHPINPASVFDGNGRHIVASREE